MAKSNVVFFPVCCYGVLAAVLRDYRIAGGVNAHHQQKQPSQLRSQPEGPRQIAFNNFGPTKSTSHVQFHGGKNPTLSLSLSLSLTKPPDYHPPPPSVLRQPPGQMPQVDGLTTKWGGVTLIRVSKLPGLGLAKGVSLFLQDSTLRRSTAVPPPSSSSHKYNSSPPPLYRTGHNQDSGTDAIPMPFLLQLSSVSPLWS